MRGPYGKITQFVEMRSVEEINEELLKLIHLVWLKFTKYQGRYSIIILYLAKKCNSLLYIFKKNFEFVLSVKSSQKVLPQEDFAKNITAIGE